MSIQKIPCGGFYVDDNAIETREGKPYLKTGGAMVVNLSADAETDTMTVDKTFEQIKNAAPNVIMAVSDPDWGNQYLPMVTCGDVDSMFALYSPQWNGQGGITSVWVVSIMVHSDNTIEFAEGNIELQ